MAFAPDHALSLISRAWHQGRLAHAFLISGSHPDDLRHLAVSIAALVNDWPNLSDLDSLRQHGAIVIEPESKLRRIKVDQMRDAERRLQLTSSGNMKLCVVSDADRMMAEAANAFLKTLEEPPDGTLILLLTRAPDQLLDTIRSRCVRVPLFRPGHSGLDLSESGTSWVQLMAAYFSAHEKPDGLRAMGLLSDFQAILSEVRSEIEQRHKDALREEIDTYGKTTDGIWLRDREDYYDNLTESSYQEQRNSFLTILYTWFGELLRRREGLPAVDLPGFAASMQEIAARFPAPDLHKRLRAVDELRRNLATTVREPLALEVAFLKAFG
jgi:DNA polymerase-3 subunit delta'